MKKLILDVTCVNASFNDAPDHFIIELSEKQINRIKQLATVVSDNNAYSIEFFDGSGEYFSSYTLETLITDGDDEREVKELTEYMVSRANDDSGRVELQQIVVREDSLKFTCVPKHCGDSETCYTGTIALSELDSDETYCVVTW